jgi:hypothetical protein
VEMLAQKQNRETKADLEEMKKNGKIKEAVNLITSISRNRL